MDPDLRYIHLKMRMQPLPPSWEVRMKNTTRPIVLLATCLLFFIPVAKKAAADTPVAELCASDSKADPKTQYEAGWRYYRGREVGKDDEQAAECWLAAAEQGNADA